jgi:hypothetical protein
MYMLSWLADVQHVFVQQLASTALRAQPVLLHVIRMLQKQHGLNRLAGCSIQLVASHSSSGAVPAWLVKLLVGACLNEQHGA